MATAKLTLIGLHQWMIANNDDLFKNLSVPTGIDRNKVINTILMNGAEFEVLYADPDFMQFLIGPWSDKWMHTMERWQKALSIDYNPLENYDRMEDWTDEMKSSDMKMDQLLDNTITDAVSSSSGSGSNEVKRAAYDSSSYENVDKAETTSEGTNSSIGQEMKSANQTGMTDHSEDTKRSGRAHGNIGVTTSQQMLESEIEISRFNLYDEISNLFLSEFCIYTY
ncbi:MAG: hypothetical protein IKW21_02300 [Lachnospiraceae bacterium]|nr:hypothetical protein [Lachnospiraceae bacterium]